EASPRGRAAGAGRKVAGDAGFRGGENAGGDSSEGGMRSGEGVQHPESASAGPRDSREDSGTAAWDVSDGHVRAGFEGVGEVAGRGATKNLKNGAHGGTASALFLALHRVSALQRYAGTRGDTRTAQVYTFASSMSSLFVDRVASEHAPPQSLGTLLCPRDPLSTNGYVRERHERDEKLAAQ